MKAKVRIIRQILEMALFIAVPLFIILLIVL